MIRRRSHPEEAIQRAVVGYLRAVLPHGWIVVHVPNGGKRSKADAGILKAMGVIAGWPDITIIGPADRRDGPVPGVWFGEVKAAKGRLSDAQVEVADRLQILGYHRPPIWRSIDDARASCLRWGLPLREAIPRTVYAEINAGDGLRPIREAAE